MESPHKGPEFTAFTCTLYNAKRGSTVEFTFPLNQI